MDTIVIKSAIVFLFIVNTSFYSFCQVKNDSVAKTLSTIEVSEYNYSMFVNYVSYLYMEDKTYFLMGNDYITKYLNNHVALKITTAWFIGFGGDEVGIMPGAGISIRLKDWPIKLKDEIESDRLIRLSISNDFVGFIQGKDRSQNSMRLKQTVNFEGLLFKEKTAFFLRLGYITGYTEKGFVTYENGFFVFDAGIGINNEFLSYIWRFVLGI